MAFHTSNSSFADVDIWLGAIQNGGPGEPLRVLLTPGSKCWRHVYLQPLSQVQGKQCLSHEPSDGHSLMLLIHINRKQLHQIFLLGWCPHWFLSTCMILRLYDTLRVLYAYKGRLSLNIFCLPNANNEYTNTNYHYIKQWYRVFTMMGIFYYLFTEQTLLSRLIRVN